MGIRIIFAKLKLINYNFKYLNLKLKNKYTKYSKQFYIWKKTT